MTTVNITVSVAFWQMKYENRLYTIQISLMIENRLPFVK